MDKNICPLFYMIMLHRRGRVDDIIISDSCGCLGEKCQWYYTVCKGGASEKAAKEKVEKMEKELRKVEEVTDTEKPPDLLFAEDKSEFSKL